jgi:transposase-like protein
MVHYSPRSGRKHYGPGSARQRHDDSGNPSSIQHSQESLRALASRYGVNQKTVAKWRQRSSVDDLRTGPKQAKSTALSVEDEAIVVAFRRHTLLPLDEKATRRVGRAPGRRSLRGRAR